MGNSPNPAIDAFYPQPPTYHSSQPIYLQAGKSYSVLLEYNETNQGGAEIQWFWQAKNKDGKLLVPQEIVPNRNLFAQKKEAGRVEFQPSNGKAVKENFVKLLGQQGGEQAFKNLAAAYGFDLTKPEQLKKLEQAKSLVQVKKMDGRIYYRFFDAVRFTSPKSTDSILQVVTLKEVDTTTNGQKKVVPPNTFVEGWVIDKDGKALALDQHNTKGAQSFAIADTKSVRVEFDITVGSGLYKNQKITGNLGGAGSIPGFFDIFPTGDRKDVTWTGPTRTYKVVFEVDNQGNWSFKDESTGVDRKGTLNAGQGGQP